MNTNSHAGSSDDPVSIVPQGTIPEEPVVIQLLCESDLQRDWNDPDTLWSEGMADKQLAAMQRERQWEPLNPIAIPMKIRPEDQYSVGAGLMRCPFNCTHQRLTVRYRGVMTGAIAEWGTTCPCWDFCRIDERWRKCTPKDYWECNLDLLTPCDNPRMVSLSVGRQQEIIDFVQGHPNDNYLFIGEGGTGKSHLAYAVFRKAMVEQYRTHHNFTEGCWAVSTPDLIEDLYQFKTRGFHDSDYYYYNGGSPPKVPAVTPPMIQKAAEEGLKPVVVLDELDKFEFKKNRISFLANIVKTTEECGGQVIGISNLTWEGLEAEWGKDFSTPILRRMGAGRRGHTVKFA